MIKRDKLVYWLLCALAGLISFIALGMMDASEKLEERVNKTEDAVIQVKSEQEHLREIMLRIEKKIDKNSDKIDNL